MTTSHTPGPWIIEPHDGYQLIRADDGHGPFARVEMRKTKTNNTTELYHNAALIAAAPDMLAALKALTADVQQDIDAGRIKAAKTSRYMRDIAAARAAIARAEGH